MMFLGDEEEVESLIPIPPRRTKNNGNAATSTDNDNAAKMMIRAIATRCDDGDIDTDEEPTIDNLVAFITFVVGIKTITWLP